MNNRRDNFDRQFRFVGIVIKIGFVVTLLVAVAIFIGSIYFANHPEELGQFFGRILKGAQNVQ